MCPECQKRGKTWEGSDPVCAFGSGVFDPKNWNCATSNRLREIAEDVVHLHWRDDDAACSFGAVPFAGEHGQGYIVMSWYKSRGATGRMMTMCDDHPPHVTRLAEAEDAIAYWQEKARRARP
jgi:hypothetical protein